MAHSGERNRIRAVPEAGSTPRTRPPQLSESCPRREESFLGEKFLGKLVTRRIFGRGGRCVRQKGELKKSQMYLGLQIR